MFLCLNKVLCENGFECAKRVAEKKKDVFGMDLTPATDGAGKSCVNIWKWKPVDILLKKIKRTKDEQLKIKKNGKQKAKIRCLLFK